MRLLEQTLVQGVEYKGYPCCFAHVDCGRITACAVVVGAATWHIRVRDDTNSNNHVEDRQQVMAYVNCINASSKTFIANVYLVINYLRYNMTYDGRLDIRLREMTMVEICAFRIAYFYVYTDLSIHFWFVSHLNVLQYNTLFSFTLFSCPKRCFIFYIVPQYSHLIYG